jgi:hypothetical protein
VVVWHILEYMCAKSLVIYNAPCLKGSRFFPKRKKKEAEFHVYLSKIWKLQISPFKILYHHIYPCKLLNTLTFTYEKFTIHQINSKFSIKLIIYFKTQVKT